jgi:hypothetical protein
MPIRIRHLKNQRRGTKLTYATIPIDEAGGIGGEEVGDVFDKLFHSTPRKTWQSKSDSRTTASYIEYKPGMLAKPVSPAEHDGTAESLLRLFANSPESERIAYVENFGAEENRDSQNRHLFFRLNKKGNNIVITPQPLIHSIRAEHSKLDAFSHLLSMLKKGFESSEYYDEKQYRDNSYVKENRAHRANAWGTKSKNSGITQGDVYSVELYHQRGRPEEKIADFEIVSARPENIISVNIEIDPYIPETIRDEKIKFYKEQITGKYGVPVRFFEARQTKSDFDRKSLEQKVSSVIAIAGILSSFFFLGSSITGNAIGNISKTSGSWLGIGLLVLGLIAGFFWLKNRKQ